MIRTRARSILDRQSITFICICVYSPVVHGIFSCCISEWCFYFSRDSKDVWLCFGRANIQMVIDIMSNISQYLTLRSLLFLLTILLACCFSLFDDKFLSCATSWFCILSKCVEKKLVHYFNNWLLVKDSKNVLVFLFLQLSRLLLNILFNFLNSINDQFKENFRKQSEIWTWLFQRFCWFFEIRCLFLYHVFLKKLWIVLAHTLVEFLHLCSIKFGSTIFTLFYLFIILLNFLSKQHILVCSSDLNWPKLNLPLLFYFIFWQGKCVPNLHYWVSLDREKKDKFAHLRMII